MRRPADVSRFTTVIRALAALFNREATEPLAHGFWLALSDLPMEAVERGAARAMRDCRFMPTPAELRELAGEMRLADRALCAWSVFERTVVERGGYKSVQFDDRILNATVQHLGGWVRCCELSCDEFDTWLRKDFLRAYEAFCRTGVGPDAGGALIGSHQRENRLLGHDDACAAALAPGCAGDALWIETGLPPIETPRRLATGQPLRVEFKRP
jgi:hypothetical protein